MATNLFSIKKTATANVFGHIICFRDDISSQYTTSVAELRKYAAFILSKVKPNKIRTIPQINNVYVNSVKAVAVSFLTTDYISRLLTHADVKSVEPDIEVTMFTNPKYTLDADDMTYHDALWALPKLRIDNSSTPVFNNINIFILDTGVSAHPFLHIDEPLSESFVPSEKTYEDLNGHGTAIAGVIGSIKRNHYKGVCPGANIIAYKCLDKNGKGQLSWVIVAIEKIWNWKHQNPNALAVVNISLGGYTGSFEDTALDVAINNLITVKSVPVVTAAGNFADLASLYTPGHLKNCITVGSYDRENKLTPWCNYGRAINVLAPGTDILSMTTNEKTQTNTYQIKKLGVNSMQDGYFAFYNGTSFSTAYVTGAIGLYLDLFKNLPTYITSSAILSAINDDGSLCIRGILTKGVITPNTPSIINIDTNDALDITINKNIYTVNLIILAENCINIISNTTVLAQNAQNAKNNAVNAKANNANLSTTTIEEIISDENNNTYAYALDILWSIFFITTEFASTTVNIAKYISSFKGDFDSLMLNVSTSIIDGNIFVILIQEHIPTIAQNANDTMANARIATAQTINACAEYMNISLAYIDYLVLNVDTNEYYTTYTDTRSYVDQVMQEMQEKVSIWGSDVITTESMNTYATITTQYELILQKISDTLSQ